MRRQRLEGERTIGKGVSTINIEKIQIHDMRTEELTKEHFPNGHRVKLFLDKDLQAAERISFHPCDNTGSVVLSNEDFRRFLEIWGGEYEWLDVSQES